MSYTCKNFGNLIFYLPLVFIGYRCKQKLYLAIALRYAKYTKKTQILKRINKCNLVSILECTHVE